MNEGTGRSGTACKLAYKDGPVRKGSCEAAAEHEIARRAMSDHFVQLDTLRCTPSSICGFQGASLESTFLDSSMVEHPAVNRVVAGSSPARGALRPHGQAVKTSPFHGGNSGSIPDGVTFL